MKPNLLVVLQTHSLGDNQRPDGTRFCKTNKSEVMRRCTRSLIESINYARDMITYFDFELVVLDDHSDDKSLEHLNHNLNISRFPTKLIHLESRGIMPSILACYEYGKKHGTDWVYFAQDDYLYEESAIYDMLQTAIFTSHALNNLTCIYPYDDPYRYIPENTAIKSHVIRHQNRHWRTYTMTSSCFMVHHQVILDNWDLFYGMGTHPVDRDMEKNTINRLFYERNYYLFVPIPSLALHIQYEAEYDPFLDYRKMWDKYDLVPNIESKLDKNKNILLHIGFGGQSIKNCYWADDLQEYTEVTMDIDTHYNPDIVCDIQNMSSIPDDSVDVIYLSHVLEHIDFTNVPTVLKEFTRILKDNGFARIIVPNIKSIIQYITEDRLLDTVYESPAGPIMPLDMLYGHAGSVRKRNNEFMRHKMCFTPTIVDYIAKQNNLDFTCVEEYTNLIITLKK